LVPHYGAVSKGANNIVGKRRRKSTLTEKRGEIRVEGKVSEPAPNGMWRVQLDNGHVVLARLGDKLRMQPIRIIPGDRVAIKLSPYDLTRGRIVERIKQMT
jgi:translation initiation factor IF-1